MGNEIYRKIQHFQFPPPVSSTKWLGYTTTPPGQLEGGMDFLRIPPHALTPCPRTCELPGSSAWVQLPDPWSTATQLEECAGALEQGVQSVQMEMGCWLIVWWVVWWVVFLRMWCFNKGSWLPFFWGGGYRIR